MKLVQMFFDWLKPGASVAPRDGAAATRRPALRPAAPVQQRVTQAAERVALPSAGRMAVPARNHATKRVRTKHDLYDQMVRDMCLRYGVRVRKWRRSMSGIAWYVEYRDGSRQRLIEAPRPKTPLSASIFLHEIGHHAIGFGVYKPRCLEEYHAWMYALQQMEAWNIEVTDKVKTRVYRSLRYAARKAQRRGIKQMPAELMPYLEDQRERSG